MPNDTRPREAGRGQHRGAGTATKWCRSISGTSTQPSPQPLEALCGFQRVPVAVKQVAHVDIPVPVKEFRYWDTARKQYVVEPGDYEILVGAASDDIRAKLALRVGGK